jgi:hypothetical protein
MLSFERIAIIGAPSQRWTASRTLQLDEEQ